MAVVKVPPGWFRACLYCGCAGPCLVVLTLCALPRTASWSVHTSTTTMATSPTAPSAAGVARCSCVGTTTAAGEALPLPAGTRFLSTLQLRPSRALPLQGALLTSQSRRGGPRSLSLFSGAFAWSVWISWWGQGLPRQPSRKTPGTATCAGTRAPTGCCGGGKTGRLGSRCSLPITMTRNL